MVPDRAKGGGQSMFLTDVSHRAFLSEWMVRVRKWEVLMKDSKLAG